MKSAKAKAMGLGGALFIAVYVPAFIATALVRPLIELAIALVIAISLLIAIFLIFLFARARSGFAEFAVHSLFNCVDASGCRSWRCIGNRRCRRIGREFRFQ